jgi:hypothetical protein
MAPVTGTRTGSAATGRRRGSDLLRTRRTVPTLEGAKKAESEVYFFSNTKKFLKGIAACFPFSKSSMGLRESSGLK